MSPNAQETRGQWQKLRNLKEGPLGAETQTFQEGLKWCSWMEDMADSATVGKNADCIQLLLQK